MRQIFEDFIKDGKHCHLLKLETTFESEVSAGSDQLGFTTIIDFGEDFMIYTESTFDFLKTSPVREILKNDDNSIEFKTRSGSIYKLSK